MKSSNFVFACLALSIASTSFAKEAPGAQSIAQQMTEYNHFLSTLDQEKLTAQAVAKLPTVSEYLVIYTEYETVFSPSVVKKIEEKLSPFFHEYDRLNNPNPSKMYLGSKMTRGFIAVDRYKMSQALAALNEIKGIAVYKASDVVSGATFGTLIDPKDLVEKEQLTFTAGQSESVIKSVNALLNSKSRQYFDMNEYRMLGANLFHANLGIINAIQDLRATIEFRASEIVKQKNPKFSKAQIAIAVENLIRKEAWGIELTNALRTVQTQTTLSNNVKSLFSTDLGFNDQLVTAMDQQKQRLDLAVNKRPEAVTSQTEKKTAPRGMELLTHAVNDTTLAAIIRDAEKASEKVDSRNIDLYAKELPVVETYVVIYKNNGQGWSDTSEIDAALSQLKSEQLENGTDPKKITDHVAHSFDFLRNRSAQVIIADSRQEAFVALNPGRTEEAIRTINKIPGLTAYRLSQVITGYGLAKDPVLLSDLTSISFAINTPSQSENILAGIEAFVSQKNNRGTLSHISRLERSTAESNLQRAFMPLVSLKKDMKALIMSQAAALAVELRPKATEKELSEVVKHILIQSNSGKSLAKAQLHIDNRARVADNYDAALFGDTTAVDLALNCNHLLTD